MHHTNQNQKQSVQPHGRAAHPTALWLLLFLSLLLPSCDSDHSSTAEPLHIAMMEAAPRAGNARCGNADHAAFNMIVGSFVDQDTVTFSIRDIPEGLDNEQVVADILRAYAHWSKTINKPISYIPNTEDVDIIIGFEFLDGIGGLLGRAQFPGTTRPQILIFDLYDMYPDREGRLEFDFFTIALHEAGHTIGLVHSASPNAVMWPMWMGRHNALHYDDISRAKYIYRDSSSFHTYPDRTWVWIAKNDRSFIAPNFRTNEFFSQCTDVRVTGHFIDSTLIAAAQFIRDFYGQAVRIISSYRHTECNSRVGGSSGSMHLRKKAIDFVFVGDGWLAAHHAFQRDMKDRNCVFMELMTLGVRGYGGYATSNHLDTRDGFAVRTWRGMPYAMWGAFDPAAYNAEEDPDRIINNQ